MKLTHRLAVAIPALGLVALAAMPTVAVFATAPNSSSTGSPNMRAFPPARADQARHVISLPKYGDEEGLRVEIIVGKTMDVDCNHHVFGGRLEQRTAEGWGYSYYVLDKLGEGASTMMGCGSQAKRTAFVRIPDELLVRYNSRLPLVVYTPSGVEVRYRIWHAGAVRHAS